MAANYSDSLTDEQAICMLLIDSSPLSNQQVITHYPTIAEIRRANLQSLIDQHGSQRALADAAEIAPAQISQWIKASPSFETGKPRVVSDDSARKLERCCGKPEGWMDHDHQAHTPPDTPARAGAPANVAQGPEFGLEQALEVIGMALAREMPAAVREDVADALAKLAKREGASRDQQQVLNLLNTPPVQKSLAA